MTRRPSLADIVALQFSAALVASSLLLAPGFARAAPRTESADAIRSTVHAPRSTVQKESADALVAQALGESLEGNESRKQELLDEALRQRPDHAPARWHRGFVETSKRRWARFDEVPGITARSRQQARYQHRRQSAADTVNDQMELANWCAKEHLADQERAHLTRVLALAPDHALARARLGFVAVDGVWMARQELEQARDKAESSAAALARYRPTLERLLSAISGKSGMKKEQALRQWEAIDDPLAIPAMELVFSTRGEMAAGLVLEKLAEMPSPEASLSLARHAVLAESHDVRHRAASLLADRDFDSFVPALLSVLFTPLQTSSEVYRAPNGRLVHRLMFYREGQTSAELSVFETSYGAIGTLEGVVSGPVRRAAQDAQATEADLVLRSADEQERTRALNDRVCLVLAAATGEQFGHSPEAWWQWWNDHNEVFVSGSKPVRETYRNREVKVTASDSGETLDCLAAGTHVWTEAGPLPVESILVGDRVLAQHPETGELAYKPVLRTTVRPPSRVFTIHTSEGPLTASGGHPLWVAGKGWVKARQIEVGAHLHGVAGALTVDQVEPAGTAPTFNLIVADFNTYFAGPAKTLNHDNTIRRPTAMLLPGLER